MSLNGLDNPELTGVYNSVLTEPGGWFLLKYSSRDTVEILDHGTAGVTEARNALIQYEEKSPVYGLIIYRRRKVLIKYIPEDTSRLLQARTTVHFSDILDKFTPYETLLEITSGEDLNDTSLAAAFPLHTASPAISTNKLDEISEDTEEGGSPKATRDGMTSPPPTARRPATDRRSSGRRLAALANASAAVPALKDDPLPQQPKSSISQFLVREEQGQRSVTSLSPSLTEYAPTETSAPDTESVRMSEEQPTSPSLSATSPPMDYYTFDQYMPKPKIKLGPRPVALTDRHGRSNIASAGRPVSALPAGYHFKAQQAEDSRPVSAAPPRIASLPEFAPLPEPPPIPDDPLHIPRPGSRGSQRSMQSSKTMQSTKTSKSAMTPERLRLMKAAELRKKQMKKSCKLEDKAIQSEVQDMSTAEIPKVPQQEEVLEASNPAVGEQPKALPNKVDSGIAMVYNSRPNSAQNSPTSPIAPAVPVPQTVPEEQERPQLEGVNTEEPENVSRPNSKGTLRISAETTPTFEQPQTIEDMDSPTLGRAQIYSPLPPMDVQKPPISPLPTIVMGDGSLPVAHDHDDEPIVESPSISPLDEESVRASPVSSIRRISPKPSFTTPRKPTDLQKKRRGLVDPLHITVDPEHQDDNDIFSSDDELMEELRSATFEEAKPVQVTKSPATPFFPRRPSSNSVNSAKSGRSGKSGVSVQSITIQRTRSDPLTLEKMTGSADRLSPGVNRSHSLSATMALEPEKEKENAEPKLIRNRSQVSSGLYKRIQALNERVVSREASPPPSASPLSPLSPDANSLGFVAMRKTSLREPSESRASSATRRADQRKKLTLATNGHISQGVGSPTEIQPVYTVERDPSTHRDSVSVTARIIRPGSAQAEEHAPLSPTSDSGLYPSPLVISHKRATASRNELPPLAPLITDSVPPPKASEPADHRASIISSDVLSPVGRDGGMSPASTRGSVDDTHHHSFRKSITMRRSKNESHSPPMGNAVPTPAANRPMSPSSFLSDESEVSKSSSRTSRFFKRMSGAITGSSHATKAKKDKNGNRNRKRDSTADYVPDISSPVVTHSSVMSPPIPSSAFEAFPRPPTANGKDGNGGRKMSTSTAMSKDVPPPIQLGDLNVQFPDNLVRQLTSTTLPTGTNGQTAHATTTGNSTGNDDEQEKRKRVLTTWQLWKRRRLDIDSHGNLVFSVAKANESKAVQGQVRRWPLREFGAPYVPDVEVMELPYSVVMDHGEGSALQCACEDASTQAQLLSVLRTYHQAWSSI